MLQSDPMKIPVLFAKTPSVPPGPSVWLKPLETRWPWRNPEFTREDTMYCMACFRPLDGVGPEDLKIDRLLGRMEGEMIEEVILATNPTTGGETTASFILGLLSEKNPGIKISRIALGVPMGGDLKFMDSMTLQHAL